MLNDDKLKKALHAQTAATTELGAAQDKLTKATEAVEALIPDELKETVEDAGSDLVRRRRSTETSPRDCVQPIVVAYS